jgi:hypothetical protein
MIRIGANLRKIVVHEHVMAESSISRNAKIVRTGAGGGVKPSS